MVGGSTPWYNARIVKMASTAPAAPSMWPVIDFVALMGMVAARALKTDLMAIVSAASLAVDPILVWSSTLRKSRSRPVFGFWGFLVGFGFVCSAISFLPRGNDYRLRKSTVQAQCPPLTRQPMRDLSEVAVIRTEQLFSAKLEAFRVVCLAGVLVGGVVSLASCCLASRYRRASANLPRTIDVDVDRAVEPSDDLPKETRPDMELETEILKRPVYWYSYINPILFVVIVALNETMLLGNGGLPESEHLYSVGQWSPWVAIGLAMVAAMFARCRRSKHRAREARLAEEAVERTRQGMITWRHGADSTVGKLGCQWMRSR